MKKTIPIDEEGFFILQGGIRLSEDKAGHQMLSHISVDENGVTWLNHDGEQIVVEPFDKPFVALQIHKLEKDWEVQLPYQLRKSFQPEKLCLDGWDRFHGITNDGIPFVLSRKAQAELFNLADSFDDDSITLGNSKIQTHDFYIENPENKNSPKSFWTDIYNESPSPPWNLEGPHPELPSILSQIKLTKRRVLVPGCGFGHDAALFAEQGHIVTAMDISPEAIAKAKELYGHLPQLEFICADIFNLDEGYREQFDIVFEHTLYCAISPSQRLDLIKRWHSWLAEGGQLLGIFFVMTKRGGPPFGSSEWEIRELSQKFFKPLYWTRLKNSPGWREGAELVVFADKK